MMDTKENKPSPAPLILVVGQWNMASTTGGSITCFHHFCALLADNGYRVTGTCHGDDPRRPSALDKRVEFVNTRFLYEGISDYPTAFNRLLDEIHPDLIVYFFPHYYLWSKPAWKFRHIPRILQFHSRPDYLFSQIPGFARKLWRYYVNTWSQVLMESFKDGLPGYIKRGPVCVIPNGLAPFQKCADYAVERKKMVYFSRVDRLKGVDLLIEAFPLIKEKHPDWSVDIYGDVEPEDLRKELLEAIEQKGLKDQIRLMGRAPRSAEDTLVCYDFCLFPSRLEGFSVGFAESMAAGLACIGLRSCSGVNEMILDGLNGLLCEDNPADIARAVCRLIEHPEEREKMGRAARSWIRQYDSTVVDMKWLRLIRNILDGETAPRNAPAADLLKRMEGR